MRQIGTGGHQGPTRPHGRLWRLPAALVVAVGFALPTSADAQGPAAGQGWRFGATLGGISSFGVSVEFFRDSRSVDVTLGTFGFRDLGVSVVGRQYFGERAARPFVGLGLWGLVSWPSNERTGLALVARAPVGIDWSIDSGHAVGAEVALNRALAVRRPDPEDDRPLNKRIVPLPGIYYRWTP
ncbi:MAG: hypothetical protein WD995_00640 [Gemmatimonadota bacterium]